MSLYVGDRAVCRFGWNWNQSHPNLHTTRSPTYSDIYQSRIDKIDSPDDEHLVARNM